MPEKSVAEKLLLIKPNTALWASDPARLALIGPLPANVRGVEAPEEAATALVFADDAATVRTLVARQARGLAAAGTLWVAYPKANRTDINRDTLWPILAEHGFRPVGQVALDEV